ncbi:hypothetical protein SADUNF_Sadunf18G0092500 [Salix dunnii]|uniref:Uncharacterized protein n=1 Tax=Salix dunnii TaxID=1413687 RepID=A0A835J3Z1_9ROSI|nr:hypothetical protein SADUNF_Sadunf18G0092500 [Salix dunnii]
MVAAELILIGPAGRCMLPIARREQLLELCSTWLEREYVSYSNQQEGKIKPRKANRARDSFSEDTWSR